MTDGGLKKKASATAASGLIEEIAEVCGSGAASRQLRRSGRLAKKKPTAKPLDAAADFGLDTEILAGSRDVLELEASPPRSHHRHLLQPCPAVETSRTPLGSAHSLPRVDSARATQAVAIVTPPAKSGVLTRSQTPRLGATLHQQPIGGAESPERARRAPAEGSFECLLTEARAAALSPAIEEGVVSPVKPRSAFLECFFADF